MNRKQFINEYFQVFGERNPATGLVVAGSTTTQANIDSADREINGAVEAIENEADWSFLRTEGRVRLYAPQSAGTISGTAGTAVITGVGTGFNKSMLGQLIVFGDNNDFQHRVLTVLSTTSMTIEDPLISTVAAGTTYTVQFDTYKFPRDMRKLITGRQMETPAELVQANTQREVQHFLLFDTTNGISNRIDLDFKATKTDFQNGGTVSTITGSPTVAGITTFWVGQEVLPGMSFRLDDGDDEYIIQSVASDTSIVLDRDWSGPSVTGNGYKIDAAGIRTFRILDYPDEDQYGIFEYQKRVNKLSNDLDVPTPIPPQFHYDVIWQRTLYEGLKKRRLPAEDVLRDYQAGLFRMKRAYLPSLQRRGHRLSRVDEGRIRAIAPIITSQNPTGFISD